MVIKLDKGGFLTRCVYRDVKEYRVRLFRVSNSGRDKYLHPVEFLIVNLGRLGVLGGCPIIDNDDRTHLNCKYLSEARVE